ncbi:hypothetical protein MTsPCn5_00030 [Croceitalea sp. MTPC5]|nr:hypothetical protein MTsPCn5_00030 [Croceitalea sp. MTPC5]
MEKIARSNFWRVAQLDGIKTQDEFSELLNDHLHTVAL